MTTSEQICELRITDGELQIAKQKLVAEKLALQAQLAEIKARLSVHLAAREYQQIMRARSEIVSQIMEKESELSALKAQRSAVNVELDVRKENTLGKDKVKQLVQVRDEWHSFSMDKHNHQKAREVAWKVSQQLRAILLPYFQP